MAEALVPGQWPGSAGLVLLEHAFKWLPWSQRGPGSTGIWKPAQLPGSLRFLAPFKAVFPVHLTTKSRPRLFFSLPQDEHSRSQSLHLTSHMGECYCLCDAPGFWVLFFLSQQLWVILMRPKVSVERESVSGFPSLTAHRATEPTQWAPHQGFLLGSTEKLLTHLRLGPPYAKTARLMCYSLMVSTQIGSSYDNLLSCILIMSTLFCTCHISIAVLGTNLGLKCICVGSARRKEVWGLQGQGDTVIIVWEGWCRIQAGKTRAMATWLEVTLGFVGKKWSVHLKILHYVFCCCCVYMLYHLTGRSEAQGTTHCLVECGQNFRFHLTMFHPWVYVACHSWIASLILFWRPSGDKGI